MAERASVPEELVHSPAHRARMAVRGLVSVKVVRRELGSRRGCLVLGRFSSPLSSEVNFTFCEKRSSREKLFSGLWLAKLWRAFFFAR